MKQSVRTEFHCHSTFSDGALEPEQLAKELAKASVRFAALTDHNCIDGQDAFRKAAANLGIGTLTGVEITSYYDDKEYHILGYGIDINNKKLQETLNGLRPPGISSSAHTSPPKRIDVTDAISLIHEASGIAVLAHPMKTVENLQKIDNVLKIFKNIGLDGVEVYRNDLSKEAADSLRRIAENNGLLLTAGSDYHKPSIDTSQIVPGVDTDLQIWKKFRDAVLSQYSGGKNDIDSPGSVYKKRGIHWRFFATQIVLPALITIILFTAVFFLFLIPTVERALIDRKREMIRELTHAAVSLCADAQANVTSGLFSEDSARRIAKHRIRAMRYGRDGKDYFWIQDTVPVMIMHPYRQDLEGTNLADFKAYDGTPIFVQFSQYVKEHDDGYMQYVWQWNDDSTRIEPKESYITLFRPWGWIIGTGVYVHDVKSEMRTIIVRIVSITLGIVIVVFILLLYMLRSSLRIEKERTSAENQLFETTERYKTLVNAATEALIFFSRQHCRYGNPLAEELTGFTMQELELLDIHDIFPDIAENRNFYAYLAGSTSDHTGLHIHSVLRRRDGTLVECSAQLCQTDDSGFNNILVSIRQVAPVRESATDNRNNILKQFLKLPQAIGDDIRAAILSSGSVEKIQELCKNTPVITESLLDNGAYAPDVANMLTSVADAAMRRLIDIGIEKVGLPPSAFAFIALGSQGRMEQTLFTDQDNAIIYSVDGTDGSESVKNYFLQLATFVCDGLNFCGYRSCKANVMASNPLWCMSIDSWKDRYAGWIQKPESHDVMEFSIFFDYRVVYGDEGLGRSLRDFVLSKVKEKPLFLTQLAQNALQFKSPLRLFGFIVGTKSGDSSQHIDLKSYTLPIVSFARLYAIQQEISPVATLRRLEMLAQKGIVLPSKLEEISTAFALLLRLRMRHQITAIKNGDEVDNVIDRGQLGHIEEAILRECFNEIDYMQMRIRRDFFGE